MASGQWPPPPGAAQVPYAEGFAGSPGGGRYELRPLSLGEILDRTFSVYRSRFWLFAGIGALSGAVQLVASAIQLLVYHAVRRRYGFGVALLEQQIGGGVATLLFFFASAVTQAATIWALSQVYLGRAAAIESSLRAVARQWYRFVGIAVWQVWSFMWLPLVLVVPLVLVFTLIPGVHGVVSGSLFAVMMFVLLAGALAFGVIAFLRNSLGVQAAVVERLRVRVAMRRSKVLSEGTRGRIFVVFLIAWCLFLVAGVLEVPMAFLVARAPFEEHMLAQMSLLVINFAAHTLVTPVVLIGLSLVYFDQRVRLEGLDLLLMLGGDAGLAGVEEAAL
jgi:hypothetical protein